YEMYRAAESNKSIHDQNKASVKAQVSKLRQLIVLGGNKAIDAKGLIQEAFLVREKLLANGETGIKPAYVYYVDIARTQKDMPERLTSAQLKDMAYKDAPAEKSLQSVLEGIVHKLETIISGENKDGIRDDSAQVIEAYEQLKERLGQLLMDEARAKLVAEAAKLGLTL